MRMRTYLTDGFMNLSPHSSVLSHLLIFCCSEKCNPIPVHHLESQSTRRGTLRMQQTLPCHLPSWRCKRRCEAWWHPRPGRHAMQSQPQLQMDLKVFGPCHTASMLTAVLRCQCDCWSVLRIGHFLQVWCSCTPNIPLEMLQASKACRRGGGGGGRGGGGRA